MGRFRFVEDHCETYPVKRLCHVLEVNRSSFYEWRVSAPARAERATADAARAERVGAVHAEHAGAYGCPRITAELRLCDGLPVNPKRVGRIMRENEIVGLRLRKRVTTTVSEPSDTPVPDLFERDFTASAPNSSSRS